MKFIDKERHMFLLKGYRTGHREGKGEKTRTTLPAPWSAPQVSVWQMDFACWEQPSPAWLWWPAGHDSPVGVSSLALVFIKMCRLLRPGSGNTAGEAGRVQAATSPSGKEWSMGPWRPWATWRRVVKQDRNSVDRTDSQGRSCTTGRKRQGRGRPDALFIREN